MLKKSVNIEDLRRGARKRLPRFIFDYVDGGAEDEISLRGNRAAFDRIALRPRTLVDVAQRSLACTLLGRPVALPLVIGPTGLGGYYWPQGDLAMAKAAAKAGAIYALSTASNHPLEAIAAEAGGRLWFQAYMFRDRKVSEALIRRAAAAGYEALVVTSDFPIPGKRERDWRNGLTTPPALTLRTKLEMLTHLRWVLQVLPTRPAFVNVAAELPPGSHAPAYVSTQVDPALNWDDFKRLRDLWPGKLLLKGVLRADDAVRAADLGADAVVLSNHGGRQLDRAPIPFHLLPEVVREVGKDTEIHLDTGIMSGADIVAAIALGARFTLVGRAYLYGLMAGGREGVDRAIEILSGQLVRTLQLLGVNSLDELEPGHVTQLQRLIPRA